MKFHPLLLLPLLPAFLGPPAFADFGTHFIADTRYWTPLDKGDKRLSFRFTCEGDINVIALSFRCEEAKVTPAYLASLREDKGGFPSGKILGSASVIPRAGWVTVPLNETPLFKGRVYHLLLEHDSQRGGGHPVGVIGSNNFASFSYTYPLNPFSPNEEKPDRKTNVLLYEGGRWKELDRQPLYAVHGTGSKLQGNPYDSTQYRPIHGNGTPGNASDDLLQGQVLHPHCGFYAKGFLVRVRKQGNPTAPLNYRVYAHQHIEGKTTLVYSGEAVTSRQVTNAFQWVTVLMKKKDNPRDFPPECRYVVFQTDSGLANAGSPGCSDCYVLSDVGNSGGLSGAADLSFDGGPHLTRATFSKDGGSTWIDEFERDAHVVILANPCGPAPELEIAPIPTPAPLWRPFAP